MDVTVSNHGMAERELPEWVIPPYEGFTAEDLDRFQDLPAQTELIDGSLVFAGPQSSFHSVIGCVLESGLRRTLPGGLRVRRRMDVVLGFRQRPTPDLVVLRREAVSDPDATFYRAEDVALAVEVTSPSSLVRDRERKPQLYAGAGIPHFWRVEDDGGRPTVYVYELDPATSAYALTGIHHDKLRLTVPFDIDIDLTEIETL